MEFRKPKPCDAEEAGNLAVREYEAEAARNHSLNPVPDIDMLKDRIGRLFELPWNLAAFEGGSMTGFLAYYNPMPEQFGRVKGCFSPLHGSAFAGEDRARCASLLFQHLTALMVQSGIGSFAVCKYAHDSEVIASFVLNGFGIRCSDSIRSLKKPLIVPAPAGVCFRELSGEEQRQVAPLEDALERHIADCPTFMYHGPMQEERAMGSDRVFAAFFGNNPVAFIKITHGGETFVSDAADTLHINGAYCLPEYRKTGLAAALISHITDILREERVSHLGVDCETINPNALHFWGKYFDAYTYSFVRRLDERALPSRPDSCNKTGRPRMDDRIANGIFRM